MQKINYQFMSRRSILPGYIEKLENDNHSLVLEPVIIIHGFDDPRFKKLFSHCLYEEIERVVYQFYDTYFSKPSDVTPAAQEDSDA